MPAGLGRKVGDRTYTRRWVNLVERCVVIWRNVRGSSTVQIMAYPENIYLVGPMGAGKTTVGRELATHLGKDFLDCDQELEKHTGADIPLIFELEGEIGFRSRESEMLAELCLRRGIVLATGGGVVKTRGNRTKLAAGGFVVYLDAPLEVLYQRTARDRNRPLLQTGNAYQRIRELVQERDPLYREVANLVVETGRGSLQIVLREILEGLPK